MGRKGGTGSPDLTVSAKVPPFQLLAKMSYTVTDILRAYAREDLGIYATVQWPTYEVPKHVQLVIDALQDVAEGRCKRLIISLPPRNGKSLTCSQLFPAWYMGKHPDHYFISTTYGEDLAVDFGRQVRNFINSPQHREIFPDCVLSDDSASAHRFTIAGKGGTYYAVGRGGPITGRGAHVLLIDDPLKDDLEASSEIVRGQLHNWYQAVARTRLMPGGAVIIVTTRWHVDDLPGWVLDNHKSENWKVINLPAIADSADDPIGRAEGEALWPDKFPIADLEQTRDGMEARLWDALYQQKPTIGGGYMFQREWLEFYRDTPNSRSMNCYLLVDPANSKKKNSDMTAMWVVGLAPDSNYYLIDMVHARLDVVERVDKVFKLHHKHRPLGTGYEETGMQSDITHIKARMDRENYHFTIEKLNSTTPKRNRIESLQPLFRKHRIWLPQELWATDPDGRQHDLVKEFVEQEYVKYPAVKHEDRLDALAWLISPKFPTTWPELDDEDEFIPTYVPDGGRYNRRPKRRGSAWAV